VNTLGWTSILSTEQAQSVLGWKPRPHEGTIIEMAQSLIEQNML
jgi:hypothetical protein